MSHESRTRLVTVVVLVAVFGAGILVGFAADSSLDAETPEAVLATEGASAGDASEDDAPRRGPSYLEVDPNEEQLARIDEIVAEHRARTTALDEATRAEYRAGFRVILAETRAAIMSVLSPEQAAEYQRNLDERYGPPGGSEDEDDQR